MTRALLFSGLRTAGKMFAVGEVDAVSDWLHLEGQGGGGGEEGELDAVSYWLHLEEPRHTDCHGRSKGKGNVGG